MSYPVYIFIYRIVLFKIWDGFVKSQLQIYVRHVDPGFGEKEACRKESARVYFGRAGYILPVSFEVNAEYPGSVRRNGLDSLCRNR